MTRAIRVIVAIAFAAAVVALLGGWHGASGVVKPADGSGGVSRYTGLLALEQPSDGCRKAGLRLQGGNVVVPDVIVAHMTARWCWQGGEVLHDGFNVNTWGAASWGWSYEGVVDTVKGGCFRCSYVYRRFYFHFSRTVQDVGQHEYPFIAITMRGDGSCQLDRTGLEGTVSCGYVAGGGSGGGGGSSW